MLTLPKFRGAELFQIAMDSSGHLLARLKVLAPFQSFDSSPLLDVIRFWALWFKIPIESRNKLSAILRDNELSAHQAVNQAEVAPIRAYL